MKNLAPHIYRQRAYVEGIYGDQEPIYADIQAYLVGLSETLGMRILFGPLVTRLGETVDPIKQAGFEGHMIWMESGVNLYTWEDGKFFTVDIYSCKPFLGKSVVIFTRKFFRTTKLFYRNV